MDRDNENGRATPPDLEGAGVVAPGEAVPGTVSGQADAARPGTTDVQAYIGRQLRAVYDDVVKQPIPDRFLDLMRQLDGIPRQ